MSLLPNPTADEAGWTAAHLGHLTAESDVGASPRFRGTQAAADAALAVG